VSLLEITFFPFPALMFYNFLERDKYTSMFMQQQQHERTP